MYITICKIASENVLYDAGNPTPVISDNLQVWDGDGGGKEF